MQKHMEPSRKGTGFSYNGTRVEPEDPAALALSKLQDRTWRLDNLYHIINEDGELVKFRLRPIQRAFLENMWYRNIILKSRQHGMTSLIDLMILDTCIFIPNYKGVIIAHKKDDAATILKSKAEIPYSNLPEDIIRRVGIKASNKTTMEFTNGSSITVTTSGRSGTSQALHVSELGYTAKHRPEVAEEIVLGSLPAVHRNGYVFIESTADGAGGQIYDMSMKALNAKRERKKLTPFDFKFFFYAWFEKPDNALSDEEVLDVEIHPDMQKYFDKLAKDDGIHLTANQKAWYAVQADIFEDKMKQEHPSTPEEAFENSSDANYYARHMKAAREEGRLHASLPRDARVVTPYFDIGVNDPCCAWFIKRVGVYFHVLGYYEDTDNGMDYHIPKCKEIALENKWNIAVDWVGPHDMKQRSKGRAITLAKECEEYGARFRVVPKVNQKILSIQASRRILSACHFDMSGPNMELGVSRLDNYRKEWNKTLQIWNDNPRKDINGHGADAFQCFAMAIEHSIEQDGRGRAQADPRSAQAPVGLDGKPLGSPSTASNSPANLIAKSYFL